MAYYNNKRILTKMVINGVPRYVKVMLTVGEQETEPDTPLPDIPVEPNTIEAKVIGDTLYLTGDNVTVINGVLTITDNTVSVIDNALVIGG